MPQVCRKSGCFCKAGQYYANAARPYKVHKAGTFRKAGQYCLKTPIPISPVEVPRLVDIAQRQKVHKPGDYLQGWSILRKGHQTL